VKLSETGEARVRGYLFILGQSLRSFLPGEMVKDVLREIDSHIRERADATEPVPDERIALEALLAELGPPLQVAQAYAAEIAIDEAVSTGRLLAVGRAVFHLATSTFVGFFASLGLFVGYSMGVAFLVLAVLKPIFPDNVGFIVKGAGNFDVGFTSPLPPGAVVRGGYAVIPLFIALGLAILVGTHRGARRFLGWWRARAARRRGDKALRPALPSRGTA
jgi:uncharacterized membrane protein